MPVSDLFMEDGRVCLWGILHVSAQTFGNMFEDHLQGVIPMHITRQLTPAIFRAWAVCVCVGDYVHEIRCVCIFACHSERSDT